MRPCVPALVLATCPRLRQSAAFALMVALALVVPRGALAANCANDSTGLIPLTDLGTDTYQGFMGGLYGGGSNLRPPAHDAAGLAIAQSIVPLDTLGAPDPGGKVVLISIGMSNATQEFSQFVPKAMGLPDRNPALVVVDCAQGGQAANVIRDPAAPYWSVVDQRLRHAGSAPAQAQVAWIKQANAGPTGGFVASASLLTSNLASIVRILHDRYPNLRLAYFTSRIYAGYATTALNPEPYAYESGFAVRWLIEAQLAGIDSLNFDPEQGEVEAPWLAWGPYLWADGLEPRNDGLVWPCDFFSASDGTHPAAGARALVSDSLLAFFSADPTTSPWFLRGAPSAVPITARGVGLVVSPNPTRGPIEARITAPQGDAWRLEVYDVTGRRVSEVARGIGTGTTEVRRWDSTDGDGVPVAPGLYWVRLSARAPVMRRLVVLDRR